MKMNFRLKQMVFLGLLVVICLGLVQAGQSADFSLPPAPAESSLKDTHQMRMGGTEVFSSLYSSTLSEGELMKYYQGFFVQNGFETVFDKAVEGRRLLRVKKGSWIVNVVVMPQGGGQSQLVITHYLLPPGLSALEEPKLTWPEMVSTLPNQDQTGEDLSFIPRPLEGVRLSSITHENNTYLTYTSTQPPQELMEFYRSQMPLQGWELGQEIDMGEAVEKVKQFPGQGDFKPALPQGASLEDLVSGGYVLNFKGPLGKAQVSLLNNNFSGKGQGSFVQIRYVKE